MGKPIYRHCIFMLSNYTTGLRRGLHYLYNETNIVFLHELFEKYKKFSGVSIYTVVTNDTSIESVKNKEPFFKDVDIQEGTDIHGVCNFEKSLNRQIDANDICLLLLTQKSMSFEELMLYLFTLYSEYVIKYGNPPFHNKIWVEKHKIWVEKLNKKYFSEQIINENLKIQCKKEDVIFSRFINVDGGIEFLVRILKLFSDIAASKYSRMVSSFENFHQSLFKTRHKKYLNQTISKKNITDLYESILGNNKYSK